MTALAPGHTLAGRFQLVRAIGAGGMGQVWLVEDSELSDRVVAKIVSADATEDELTLLRQECRHARKLVHPNIVPVYDFHRTSERCFITMAYVEGTSIRSLRGRPLDEVLPALVAIADALDYAHRQGIVHRDLTVSNVLIDPSGEPQLVDFGISGLVSEAGSVSRVVRGGGVDGYASPQQVAGRAPTPLDDIYSFGVLARDLTSGPVLPNQLETLLVAMTNRDPNHRPRTMREVKDVLVAMGNDYAATPSKDVKLTPPPRVSPVGRVEPIAPPSIAPADAPAIRLNKKPSGGGIGAKTIAAFAVFIALGGVVFFVLPDWAERTREAREATETGPAAPAERAAATPDESDLPGESDLEELAQIKARAESLFERATALRESLDSRAAGIWGGTEYRDALDALTAGGEQMGRRAFADAEASFGNAAAKLEAVDEKEPAVFADAMERGLEALAAGSAVEAEDAFSLAARIRPGSTEAARGVERARVLDDLRALVARGHEAERRGDLESAKESYRKAVGLDPRSQDAQQGLARIDARASENAFTRAMSEAVAALNRKDFPAARDAFQRAAAVKPQSPDVASGLAAVERGERVERIATHRKDAEALERNEEWRSAEQQYRAALALDGTIRFAQEGQARTAARAVLFEKLAYQIANPERLSEQDVLDEASATLREARGIDRPGPKHERQIVRLTDLVSEYSTPVQVHLLSDNLTEVVVYRVGTIGKFDRHALVLRPGTYTVVGRRQGYRDVRHQLVVRADAPPEPLTVRCEEEI